VKLLLKFNLIFVLVFSAGLAVSGYFANEFLQRGARAQVAQQARLMMQTALAARMYTTSQIKPLLETQQAHQIGFLPQTVPAFAATESFEYLRAQYPDYSYKEATLNPTNLRDRAGDWETDVINTFRDHTSRKEILSERDTPTGRVMFLARPISADPPCLACHDIPKIAPAALIRRYGREHGFGWKANEIVGAQIVSVPMTVPLKLAEEGILGFMTTLGGVFLITLALLNLVLFLAVIRPIRRLAAAADRISLGKVEDCPELPVHGNDEISMLAASFNRLRRSLVTALGMIESE
jgi:HAMP domain-containing protein